MVKGAHISECLETDVNHIFKIQLMEAFAPFAQIKDVRLVKDN